MVKSSSYVWRGPKHVSLNDKLQDMTALTLLSVDQDDTDASGEKSKMFSEVDFSDCLFSNHLFNSQNRFVSWFLLKPAQKNCDRSQTVKRICDI